MRNRKSNLDEMQEQKLLQVEKNGMWLAFWGLLIAMVVQMMIYGFDVKEQLIGEWVVFMCLALYMIIGCMRIGVWDRRMKADAKTNFLVSLLAGVVTGVILAIINYRSYQMIEGAIATFVINVIVVFVMCFVGLTFVSHLYKKRLAKLEQEVEDEEE
ncbi:MAG: hypothetical protein J6B68_10495 [Lachnospiraceae bacterium]|nr:hypothetical protein [Lachnospiraceae bacterium]